MSTPWSDRVAECRDQFQTERNHQIRAELGELISNRPVLEVGCGTAELRNHVAEYIGLDITRNFQPDIWGDATELPVRSDTIPTVISKNCLQHIPEWRQALRECCRVASERVILAERTHTDQTMIIDREPCLRRRFSEADLIATLTGVQQIQTGACESDDRLSIITAEVR